MRGQETLQTPSNSTNPITSSDIINNLAIDGAQTVQKVKIKRHTARFSAVVVGVVAVISAATRNPRQCFFSRCSQRSFLSPLPLPLFLLSSSSSLLRLPQYPQGLLVCRLCSPGLLSGFELVFAVLDSSGPLCPCNCLLVSLFPPAPALQKLSFPRATILPTGD